MSKKRGWIIHVLGVFVMGGVGTQGMVASTSPRAGGMVVGFWSISQER